LKAKDNTRIYFWKIDFSFSFKLYRHHRRLVFFKREKITLPKEIFQKVKKMSKKGFLSRGRIEVGVPLAFKALYVLWTFLLQPYSAQRLEGKELSSHFIY
jgi:hypothetical protein